MESKDFKVYARFLIGLLLAVFIFAYFDAIKLAALPIMLGALVAVILVEPFKQLLSFGFSERKAAFICAVLFSLGFCLCLYIGAMPVLKSAYGFFVSLPRLVFDFEKRFKLLEVFSFLGIFDAASKSVTDFLTQLLSASSVMSVFWKSLKWLYVLFLTPVFAYYFLKDKNILIKDFNYIVPQNKKVAFENVVKEIYIGIKTYLFGYMFIGVISMGVSMLCFGAVRLESFLFLSFFMGVCSFIPFIGPFLGGVPALLVSAGNRGLFWYVVFVIAFVFYLSSAVLTPRIIDNSVNIHPAFGIAAMIFGYGIWGVFGVITAVPLLLVVSPIFKYAFSLMTTK